MSRDFSDLLNSRETEIGINDKYMTDEWRLPEKQVLLSGDGHYFITLEYRESAIPRMRWIDTECDEDIHVADSFEDFLKRLVSDEQYAE